jgi:hypothetical protein
MKLEFISQTRGTGKTTDLEEKARFDFTMNRKIFIFNHSENSTRNMIHNLKKLDVQAKPLDKDLNCLRGLREDVSIFIDEVYMIDFKKFEDLLQRIEEYSFLGSHNVNVYCTGTPHISICDYLFRSPRELEKIKILGSDKNEKVYI